MSIHAKTLIFVLGTLLGIVIGERSMYASEVGICALVLGVIQMGLYMWERKRNTVSGIEDVTHRISFPLITMLVCLGLFLGIIRMQFVEEKNNFTCESSCTFDAVIVSAPTIKNEYQLLSVHPVLYDDVRYVLVRAPLYPRYEIGDKLRVSGKVILPSIIMPHDNDNENNNRGFDYASYLRTKNIGSELSYPKIEVLDSKAHTLTDVLGRWKENLVTRIDMYVSSPSSSIASGMLFGVTGMSEELLQTFRTAGLSHIIVLSGFNIVIVITSILFVLAFVPLTLRILLASCFVIIFVMMVGGSPSVIRATIMAFIALLAMSVGRQYVARQALILSLFAIVMYEPYALTHDVSLHLSFLATMGLVYMSEPLSHLFEKIVYITSTSLRELLITTLSAYFATLPYVMYTFGTVSVYALIANILVVPLVPLAMLLSFLVVVSSYMSHTVSLLVGYTDTLLVNVMIGVARVIEALPFSKMTLTVSFEMMCLLYGIIFLAIHYISRRKYDETQVTTENGYLTDIISY